MQVEEVGRRRNVLRRLENERTAYDVQRENTLFHMRWAASQGYALHAHERQLGVLNNNVGRVDQQIAQLREDWDLPPEEQSRAP